jgi:hypothetical protein
MQNNLRLTTSYRYDRVGMSFKRSIRTMTPFEVNAVNQVVRGVHNLPHKTRSAGSLTNDCRRRYEKYAYYDANDNVAREDIQNVDDGLQVVRANPY